MDLLQRQDAYAVVRGALELCLEYSERMTKAMLDKDKMVIGDVELSDEDTVSKVAEMVRSGVLQVMQQHVNPQEAKRIVSEGAKAVERLERGSGL